jgi:hypothetical protein
MGSVNISFSTGEIPINMNTDTMEIGIVETGSTTAQWVDSIRTTE